MRAVTEDEARRALGNVSDEERARMSVPTAFLLLEWDHTDFAAWRDPKIRDRGYILVETGGTVRGIMLRASDPGSRVHAGICNMCHTLQPGDQVTTFSARRGGDRGRRGDSIGTMACADLTCHDSVRLAAPLAPGEVRTDVDHRIDSTRSRIESFVDAVLEDS